MFSHRFFINMMFIYFVGEKLHIVDRETGEITEVEVFLSVLGTSQLTYLPCNAAHCPGFYFHMLMDAKFPALLKIKPRCFRTRVFSFVGVRRLELPTSTSRTWRASQLCYTPKINFRCAKIVKKNDAINRRRSCWLLVTGY